MPLSRLNTVVLPAIARASDSTTRAVTPGVLLSERSA